MQNVTLWFQSKTIWFNILTILVFIATYFGYSQNPEIAQFFAAINPFVNLYLRSLTKTPLALNTPTN